MRASAVAAYGMKSRRKGDAAVQSDIERRSGDAQLGQRQACRQVAFLD